MADACAVIRYANPSIDIGYAGIQLPSVEDTRIAMNGPADDELAPSLSRRAATAERALGRLRAGRHGALSVPHPLTIAAAVDAERDRAWDALCDARDREEAESEAAFAAAADVVRECDASTLARLTFEHLDGLGADDGLAFIDRLLAAVRDADRDGLELPAPVQTAWNELHDALCVAIAS